MNKINSTIIKITIKNKTNRKFIVLITNIVTHQNSLKEVMTLFLMNRLQLPNKMRTHPTEVGSLQSDLTNLIIQEREVGPSIT